METNVKNQIIANLEEYLEHHGMSASVFAKKSGINAAIISNLRSGKTTINAGQGHDVVIADKYYEMIAQTIGLKLKPSYWEVKATPEMQRILATLEEAKEYGITNLLIGETGCGKTFISRLFAQQHPMDCYMITVGSSDNIGDLLDKVIDTMKIPTEKSKSRKLKAIMKHLREQKINGQKPMIIFDESEYMKQPALCSMKELYDNLNGHCSVIMAGTPQLLNNLDKLRKKNKEGIPQFYRRVKFGIRVLPAIDRTFKLFLNGIEDKALVKFLCSICDNYGELHDVMVPALREAERTGEVVSEKLVRTMLNMPI